MYDEKTRLGPQNGKVAGQQDENDQFLWSILATLLRWRRFIAITTLSMGIAAVIISLLLPKWYRATTRLLLPEASGGGALSAMLNEMSPIASSILGGGAAGDYNRYLSVLTSQRVMNRVIDRFDLETEYDTKDSRYAREQAVEALRDNVDFIIDDQYGFLAIKVLDRSPQQAADMANFFVSELNRINADLLAQSASDYRRYLEIGVRENERKADSLRLALQTFQEKYGIIDLPAQSQVYLEAMSAMRVESVQKEIEYQVLLKQYGPDNPQVSAARDAVQAAHVQMQRALEGGEQLLPIPKNVIPAIGRQYTELVQEGMIEAEILKYIRPLYEQAKLDEQRKRAAVQVVDPATAPLKKYKPKRAVIVVLVTLSAFLLSIMFAVVYEWAAGHRSYLATQLMLPDRKRTTRDVPVNP